jgi:hypothetical protein
MAPRTSISAGILVAGLVAGLSGGTRAAAQTTEQAPGPSPKARADQRTAGAGGLRQNEGLVLLDYQSIRVKGDQPIDLMGFHVHNKVADGLYFGAGFYAPLIQGQYGGFTAFDIGVHARRPLAGRLFATAGLSAGGGAGGRSVEQAKALSGTGGFYKGYLGLGVDFNDFALGVNVSKMRFGRSAIDGTQANAFLEVPFGYLTGAFSSHGQPLSAADARQAAAGSDERMLTVVFDNFRQRNPEGSFKGSFSTADLQYAHYFARDTFWYAGIGVGWRGMPLYNQVLGGVGQRFALSPRVTLYGQLGVGSGGYAPEKINTDAGLLVYPRVWAEYALTRELGLSLSAGYLVAPKGTSKNASVGLALTHHIRAGQGPGQAAGGGSGPRYQAFRVSLFQQVDTGVRFLGIDRGRLQMIGIQADAIVDDRWYIPLQASVAYSTYLGYPGYGELLAGIGLQSRAAADEPWQVFGQVLAGTNVHGLAVKAGGGVRYGLNERTALHLSAGHIVARSAAGNRFVATSVGLGLDYRFSIPTW